MLVLPIPSLQPKWVSLWPVPCALQAGITPSPATRAARYFLSLAFKSFSWKCTWGDSVNLSLLFQECLHIRREESTYLAAYGWMSISHKIPTRHILRNYIFLAVTSVYKHMSEMPLYSLWKPAPMCVWFPPRSPHNCSHPLLSLMVPHDFTPRTGASWHSESQWWNRKSDKALESMSHWKVRKWSFCSEKNVANYHLSAQCYYRAVWPAETWLRQWKPRGVSR